MSKYGAFSGPYFSASGLNTEIYGVNLRVHSEYRKIRTKKDSVFGHFSRSIMLWSSNMIIVVKDLCQISLVISAN